MKAFATFRRPVRLTLASSALALSLSLGVTQVHAQEAVPVSDQENGNLWFVELSGAPVAGGVSLTAVRNEKAAFRKAAAAAGVVFKERMSFDTLFNGFSVEVSPGQRAALARVAGVKAMYPVEIVQGPTPEQREQIRADLATAISMTGASTAQNSLGLTGAGIKVGIVDTGIDIDHPAFGGSGTNGTTPFPTARVAAGYDFVGDSYNSSGTADQQVPAPDSNPDDCGGHGTHVAGIVGGNGGGIRGVAPGVTFGAYRVFGCVGTSSADIIVAALERAYADGMQVINQSLGNARQWPEYPTAQASSRLVDKGVVMVASIGNNGPGGSSADALFAAGAPGVGSKVIGVASYDNAQLSFTVNSIAYGYNQASGSPIAPMSGSLPLARTWNGTLPLPGEDGCNALPSGSLNGQAVLIRRGTCSFHIKAANAQAAGAAAVVLYNNAAGALNITVAGPVEIKIPVVAVTDTQGAALNAAIAAGHKTLTWTGTAVVWPLGSGGLISGFSSFGLAADLTLKPQLGAPGGGIVSSYPLELGGTATLSGTSMSSPHVAGGVALILEARPGISSDAMVTRLQNSADPKNWSGNPALGLLDHVHRQGAGMLDIVGTIQATTVIEPSQLSVGESGFGPKTFTINVKNEGKNSVTYELTHLPGLATGPNLICTASPCAGSYSLSGLFSAPASVSFSVPSITVSAGSSASFDVTIDANTGLPNRSIYGGYVALTVPGQSVPAYRVPFAGFKGDYQSTQILTPTPNGFPWLAQLAGGFYNNRPNGATYTMVGEDIPFFLIHLDHHARQMEFSVFNAANGRPVHPVFNKTDVFDFVGRNATPGGFFAFTWDGTRMHDNGKGTPDHRKVVPNGDYVIVLRVLKPLGDRNNPAHWETWTSPTIRLARP